MNIRKRITVARMLVVLLLCMLVSVPQTIVKAAQPKVLVSAFSVNPKTVVAGEEFTLSLTLTNTYKNKVKNMKVTVCSENGDLYAVGTTGSLYVAEIAGNSDEEIAFSMCASAGLSEKSYKLTVKMEYEDNSGYSYTMEDSLFLPVTLRQRLSVTDILSDTVKVGDDLELSAKVNNLGEGNLYNVRATIEGNHVETQTTHIGTIEAGKSGNLDIITSATRMTDSTEVLSQDTLTIIYEDKAGNEYTENVDVWFSIGTVSYEDLEVLKEAPKDEGIGAKGVAMIGVCALLAVVIVIRIIKWRKKKKYLEEI